MTNFEITPDQLEAWLQSDDLDFVRTDHAVVDGPPSVDDPTVSSTAAESAAGEPMPAAATDAARPAERSWLRRKSKSAPQPSTPGTVSTTRENSATPEPALGETAPPQDTVPSSTTSEQVGKAEKPEKADKGVKESRASRFGGVPIPDIYRVFRPYLRERRGLFAVSVVLVLIATLVGLLKPWPLKYLFDEVLVVDDNGATKTAAQVQGMLLAIVIALAVITLVDSLLNFARSYVLTALGESVSTSVQHAMYRHLQSLSMRFHNRQRVGDLLTRLTSDVEKVQSIITVTVIEAGANVMFLIGMMIVMFFLDWQLSLIMLGLFPVLVLVVNRFRARIKKAEQDVRATEGDIASLAEETLSAMPLVKAYGLEAHESGRLHDRAWTNYRQQMHVLRVAGVFGVALDLVTAIALGGLVWLGAQRVISGALTPGELIIITAYLREIIAPARALAKLPAKLAKASVRAEKIVEILNAKPEVVDAPDAIEAPELVGRIELRGVNFGYDPEQPVLHGVDLTMEPGQTVAIVGATGAGKSTLVGLLLRLYDPDAGAVLVDGVNLRQYAMTSYQNQLAVVLQQTMLFHTTVRENICYGRPNATMEDVVAAAKIADAHGFISELPDGYDTVLGERGATLSGGQRQRLAIARTVLRDGRILILDEPTTGLDARCERDVLDAIERVTRGRTTVIISHQLSAVVRADVIVVLDGGRIVEQGTHDELVARGGRYADLARLQGLIALDSGRPNELIDTVLRQHRAEHARAAVGG